MLFVEMVLLDKFGFSLQTNSYPLNETIRFLIRMIWPFLILIIVAKLTKPENKEDMDRFYVKMKTPAVADKKKDEYELALSYGNPGRFDHHKIWPNSNWEFCKFDKTDVKGIVVFTIAGIAILFIVYFVSLIGK